MRASRSCERESHVPWRPAAGVGAGSLGDLPLERLIDDVKRALDIKLEADSWLVSIWDERAQHAASMQRDVAARLSMVHARRRRLEERWSAVHVRLMREQAVTTCVRTDAAPQSREIAAIQPSMEAVDRCFEWCLRRAGSGNHRLGLSLNLVLEPAGEQDDLFFTVNVVEPGGLVAKENTRLAQSGQASQILESDRILSVNGCTDVRNIREQLRGSRDLRICLQRGSTDAPGAEVAADTGVPSTSLFVAAADYDPHEESMTGYLSLSKGDVVHVYWGTEAAAEAGDSFPGRQYVFATRPDAATNPAERSSGWVPRDVLRAVQCT